MKNKALIYCRVSSQRQVVEGGGLSSQQQRCQVYANSKGYEVVEVFHDDGVSGGLLERPDMRRLISYLDNHPAENFVVIFDDLARFARDLKVHLQLKTELVMVRGVKLESPNFVFEDTPEGEFIENVLASKAQLDRQQNRRQVIQKMKARLELGYWTFCMPKGLINKKDPIHGKILVRREPYATIYKEGIEKYRDGIFLTIESFQDFVNSQYKIRGISHRMSHETARQTLKEILYAGYIEYPKWNIPRQKAKHDGFISIDTYERVQERLQERAKPRQRKDYNLDFPLRSFVLCSSCGNPMTASWNKGRTKSYANYFCRTKGCKYVWKVNSRINFEEMFEAMLLQNKPKDEVLSLTKDLLKEIWSDRIKNIEIQRKELISNKNEIEIKIERLINRISNIDNEELIPVYEEELRKLSKEKSALELNLNKEMLSNEDFGTAVDKVLDVINNPLKMWRSESYSDKQTLLLMYFEGKLKYDYIEGFGTTSLAYPISLITKKPPVKEAIVEMSSDELESKKALIKKSTSVFCL